MNWNKWLDEIEQQYADFENLTYEEYTNKYSKEKRVILVGLMKIFLS